MTTTTENHPTDAAPSEDAESIVAMLRTRRKRQAATRTRVFELPGYDDLIGARLRTVDERGVLNDANVMLGEGEASEGDAKALFDARRLTIVRSTVEIVVRASTGDVWRPLADELKDGLGPVKFDQRLIEALGGTVGPNDGAIEATRFVMSNALTFLGFYTVFAQWCSLDNPLDDDELVGESSAAS